MAIEVCSEISSVGISPRISFSHDLNQADSLPSSSDCNRGRLDLSLLESDFDFCIGNLLLQDLSSADELFCNGKILPVEIKKSIEPNREVSKPNQSTPPIPPDPPRSSVSSEKKSLKELLSASFDAEEKPQSKSFWQFKRSSSLNCESSKSRGLIRSLHFLSRSNSTGSALNLQKQPSISSRKSSVSSCSNSYFANSCSQKPSTRRNFGANNGNGVRIMSPLLNLPPPYISKVTVSFFGFGSLFCNGKNKKKNK
ncbi:uncharacterized protein LOC111470497 isoform X2 [Cucurbita maxima]|uniref:Uncharacterized protein LOC111470497 isoform X2 n=1 Tax=Cucurbita maxima TaxID=3661 RepID=A0A6J1I9N3_CUCMA|nr:uncharacterized protein LOC111470497 isoform X2 [Cucurbita maxima]